MRRIRPRRGGVGLETRQQAADGSLDFLAAIASTSLVRASRELLAEVRCNSSGRNFDLVADDLVSEAAGVNQEVLRSRIRLTFFQVGIDEGEEKRLVPIRQFSHLAVAVDVNFGRSALLRFVDPGNSRSTYLH
jgi:hypothetical protein